MTTQRVNLLGFWALICGLSVNIAAAHEQTLVEFLAANQTANQEVSAQHSAPKASCKLSIDGREVFKPVAAKQLIATLQKSIEQIRTKGAFNSAQDRRVVMKIYEDAILKLYERLQAGDASR